MFNDNNCSKALDTYVPYCLKKVSDQGKANLFCLGATHVNKTKEAFTPPPQVYYTYDIFIINRFCREVEHNPSALCI